MNIWRWYQPVHYDRHLHFSRSFAKTFLLIYTCAHYGQFNNITVYYEITPDAYTSEWAKELTTKHVTVPDIHLLTPEQDNSQQSNTSSKNTLLTLYVIFYNYIPANKLVAQSNEIIMTTILCSESIKTLKCFVTLPAVWACDC